MGPPVHGRPGGHVTHKYARDRTTTPTAEKRKEKGGKGKKRRRGREKEQSKREKKKQKKKVRKRKISRETAEKRTRGTTKRKGETAIGTREYRRKEPENKSTEWVDKKADLEHKSQKKKRERKKLKQKKEQNKAEKKPERFLDTRQKTDEYIK